MSARSRRRRVLSAALALVGALALAVPVSGAAVAPTPSPSPADPDLPVSVQITEVAPSVLRPGEDLRVRATLRNDGDEAIDEARARLCGSAGSASVSRADLDAWASAGTSGAEPHEAATSPTPGRGSARCPARSVEVELVVPAADVGLLDGADTWGPRGLVVEALDGARRVGLQRTFLLWLPDDDVPRTPLSVLVPMVGPPSAPAPGGTGPGPATVAGSTS